MSPTQYEKTLVWGAANIDPAALQQANRAARLPFVPDYVAVMPDAHWGRGSTVGTVLPTLGAIVPSCIGVDIGCGMVACLTDLRAADLPDSLTRLQPLVAQRIPAGVGKGHEPGRVNAADTSPLGKLGQPYTKLTSGQDATIVSQFGTLGSGNHFVEVCLDEQDRVWTVLHSGSRGIGNQLATKHIAGAKKLMKARFIHLEDEDLAYLVQSDPEFKAYISDMLWAQKYAMASREQMAREITRSLFEVAGHGRVVTTINCHHNFTQMEHHHGKKMWITRKGAIKADKGDLGIIPGSMGTQTYIVEGLGNPASYHSCSHGAGRRLSRGQAKRELDLATFKRQMTGKVWDSGNAQSLLDEAPGAYKNVKQVMADQADLCRITHTLHQVFNYKGTDDKKHR